VGTRLATAYDQAALGGVYKLSAVRDDDGQWEYRLKLSEQMVKTSDPGILQIRRFRDEQGQYVADVIHDEPTGIDQLPILVPLGSGLEGVPVDAPQVKDLLIPVYRGGDSVYEPPAASEARSHVQDELASLDGVVTRLEDPEPYLVGLEKRLYETKANLIAAAEAASRSRKN
jgi:nicotinate phosphoribosyltransferase